jgi:phosphatidylserine/phosphatidylglycerophosphate/cardiolipin synthase-like enzyme
MLAFIPALLLAIPTFAAGELSGYDYASPKDFKPEIRNTPAGPSDDSFRVYVKGYVQPQLFQNNDRAFAARLKLLDQAPPGATVKVLTFVFDNGEVTRRLSTHLCLAAKRGVNVELIADSKSGDRPAIADVFDSDPNNRINEENYQYMANCGVKVVIHNHLAQFNSLFGHNIPKVTNINTALTTIYQLKKIADDSIAIFKEEIESKEFKAYARDEFRASGLTLEFLDTLKPDAYRLMVAALVSRSHDRGAKSFWQKTLELLAKAPGLRDPEVSKVLDNPALAPDLFDQSLAAIHEKFSALDLNKVKSQSIGKLYARLKVRFDANPGLVAFYEHIRRFNRLNHRKLFLVETRAGEGCMFLGGRNLGDHYLAAHHDSFLDGDVLYCRHHGEASKDVLNEGSDSFDELKNSLADDVLGNDKDAATTEYQPVKGFQYAELIVPHWLRDPLSAHGQGRTSDWKSVSEKNRTLLDPAMWKDQLPIQGMPLYGSKNWRVHRVNWQPKIENDPVRQALIKAIQNETEEVYIETAYAEFDDALRAVVEAALDRGVNVRLVTNGLFVSDGPSKAIRVFMGLWLRDLQVKYDGSDSRRGKFDVLFASLEAGHMIHFKGAGFRCQKEAGKDPYRTFLIGSHNFHPRSGYSDKEHALQWDAQARETCRVKHGLPALPMADMPDMVDYRDRFYAEAQAYYKGGVLKKYSSIKDELEHVLSLDDKKAPPERKRKAKLLLKTLYRDNGELRGGRGTEFFLEFLREAGVRDFLGIVL